MSVLNLAGSPFDFGNVLFAVLQECEHRRRGLLENEAQRKLLGIAREKLDEIHRSYVEAGGSTSYWHELEREVLDTAMGQYAPAAIEQTRLERSNYDLWHGGDAVARGLFCLGGLALGGLIVAAPFIPIWEDAFAFVLAGGGFFWPEIKRQVSDYRHARFLNKMIVQAEKYQKDNRIHYVSSSEFDEALHSLAPAKVGGEPTATKTTPHPKEVSGGSAGGHQGSRGRERA